MNEAWAGIISTGERIKEVARINIFTESKTKSLEINESKYSMYLIQSEFLQFKEKPIKQRHTSDISWVQFQTTAIK